MRRATVHERAVARGDAEMAEHETGDVLQRPLLADLVGPRIEAAEQQRPERVARVQRAMAAAGTVRHPAPVDELVVAGRRDQNLAGVRGAERRPQPSEPVGVGVADQAAVARVERERAEVAVEVPTAPPAIAVSRPGPEAKLAAGALDHRLGGWLDEAGPAD